MPSMSVSAPIADFRHRCRVSVASTDSIEEEIGDDVVLTKSIDDKVVETSRCHS
jgi:hypothetical protein